MSVGTFAEPLAADTTTCPDCHEETLREVEPNLISLVLPRMLEAEDQREFERRVEVRCPCGWSGSRWK